jgi:asparagine synthase (glutamine-hydrolysing)
VARLARDSGIKPVLSGEGADELFFGYPQLLARRFDSAAAFPVNFVKSMYKVLPALHNHLFPSLHSSPLSLLNALVQGFEIEQLRDRAAEKLSALSPRAFREQYLTINLIKEHLVTLLHRNDRIGMMSSIEARIPFLDRDIVKFAVNLPSKFKIGRSLRPHNFKHPFLVDKWVVRKTAEKYLPIEIARKKKNGFPMYGHKFVRVKNGFFANGWITESLGLSRSSIDLLTEQNPYLVAKLASVEIFGRIFGLNQSVESVREHVEAHSELLVENNLPNPWFTKSASLFYQRPR